MASVQSGTSSINFFDLPLKVRNAVYRNSLIVPHPLYLFQDPGSRVELFAPDAVPQWPALLYVNRQMHQESRAVLYGGNKFHLVDITRGQVNLLSDFLIGIGTANASLLPYMSINFPIVTGQLGSIGLREDSLQELKLLKDNCTSLTTLEVHIHNNNSSPGVTNVDQQNLHFVQEALSHVDMRFKNISSLDNIIVRIYDQHPTSAALESMRALGWTVLPANRNHW